MFRACVVIFSCLVIAYAAYTVYAINHPHLMNGADIQWSNIPPIAQEKIITYAQGGQINKIVKGTRKDRAVYRTEVVLPDGEEIILKIEETGKLIGLKYKNDTEDFGNEGMPRSYPTR